MDPQDYIDKITDPNKWFNKAKGLVQESHILIEEHGRISSRLCDENIDSKEREYLDRRFQSLIESALLLSALGLENCFKGLLLLKQPEGVEVTLTLDGSGEPTGAQLEEIGGHDINHNLLALAKELGLMELENNPVVEDHQHLGDFRDSMRFLSKTIKWAGRYPAPLDFDEQKDLRDEIEPDSEEYYDFLKVSRSMACGLVKALVQADDSSLSRK